MKKGGFTERKKLGFTIVETMIVLAVSGGLFLIAALYINGKQAKTEFQVGVRDVQTKIQQVINEVNSGYYPTSDFNCSTGGIGGNLTISTPGSTAQGSHDKCIFAGKTLVISQDTIQIFTLAGQRSVPDGGTDRDVRTPQEAHITAIAPATGVNTSAPPNVTEKYVLPDALTFTGKYAVTGESQTTFAFSFMSSFAQSSGNMIGSQTLDIRGFTQSFAAAGNTATMADLINAEQARGASAFPKVSQERFCLKSGDAKQSAWIVIGGTSIASTAVHTEIKGNPACNS